jgi:hypothetical protein
LGHIQKQVLKWLAIAAFQEQYQVDFRKLLENFSSQKKTGAEAPA